MARFRNFLAAGAALAISAGAAQASVTTATATATFGPGLTDFSNASMNLPLFNPALGTLTAVTFTSTYGFTSTITVTNQGQNTSTGTVKTESAAGFGSGNSAINSIINTMVDTQGTSFIGAQSLPNSAYDVTGTTGLYSVATGSSQQVSSNKATTTIGPFVDTTPGDFAAFLGTGNFTVLFNTLTGTDQTNTNGNSSSTQATTATATFGIAYTYNAPVSTVPEPASMALLGAGLVGLGMFRRKK